MTPIWGWSRRGSKLVAHTPFGKWQTLTFLAALRHDRIYAPSVLDGPINGETFTAYVIQFLVPTLSSGDVVTRADAERHIARYIDGLYSPVRRHSALDYLSPAQFEKQTVG